MQPDISVAISSSTGLALAGVKRTVLRTDDNRAICMVALFLLSTGCRLNEALQATWGQIDRQTRVWRKALVNAVDPRLGSMDDLEQLAESLRLDDRSRVIAVHLGHGNPAPSVLRAIRYSLLNSWRLPITSSCR